MSSAAERLPDWEAFYRDYRKPGYVAGFEITSKLGGGMFGLVFRARRMSIGKDYAIKFLQVDDGEVRRAVLGELESVKYFAQIDHPNLVSIEDRGEVDGIPYLVMAFAGTETLRDKMPNGRVPTAAEKDELLRYFLQCCRGLAALHERSLVHFDIKPANVFLKGGVARLGDYGLSKLVTHSRGSLTMGRGTPYYMAPEMLQRRGDQRSDLYSLGVLLYEILCGKVPFTGDSEWEVLRQHETADPDLPAHLTPRERAVLQRCLQKDPAARFASVHDVIAAFGAPASAGAAAWTDVRPGGAAPASRPTTAPPPLPGASPPPASGERAEEDPVAGLGRASREALRHAGTLAQRAATQAGKIAQKAAAEAQRAIGSVLEQGRKRGDRSGGAFRRWRERRRQRAAERRAMAAGAARPRWRGRWLFALVGVVAFLFFFLRVARFGRSYSYQSYAPQVAAAPSVGSTMRSAAEAAGLPRTGSVFATVSAPTEWSGHVSLSEPAWVALVAADRDRAHDELLAHINRLKQVAPINDFDRVTAVTLPSFIAAPSDRQLQARVEKLMRRRPYEADLARQLAADAPASLVLVAQELTRIRWRDAADFERGVHLQRLLEDATGCAELRVLGEAGDAAVERESANAKLGQLWLWFVNEFAATPRTWRAYCELLPRRGR